MDVEKTLVGVWVDHRSAWIVRNEHGEETIQKVESDLKSKVKGTGGSRFSRTSYHRIEGWRKEHAHKFYQEVVAKLEDADEFFLMGPGSAKAELKSYITKIKPLAGKLRDTLTADKMTESELRASVREYFQ